MTTIKNTVLTVRPKSTTKLTDLARARPQLTISDKTRAVVTGMES